MQGFYFLMKKSLTIRLWQYRQKHPYFLRREVSSLRYSGSPRPDFLWRDGTGHAGRPQNGTVRDYFRYGRHVQFFSCHDVLPVIQPDLRQGGRRIRRMATGSCTLPARRILQYRADPEV